MGNRDAAVEHLTSAFEIYTHRLVRSAAGGTVLPVVVLYTSLYFHVLLTVFNIGAKQSNEVVDDRSRALVTLIMVNQTGNVAYPFLFFVRGRTMRRQKTWKEYWYS